MTITTSVSDEIAQIEHQLNQLRHRSVQDLRFKLAEAKHTVAALEEKIRRFSEEGREGTIAPGKEAPKTSKRTRITIEQVVEAIAAGATNYRQVAARLGCSSLTVAKKVEAEGKAAGIRSRGQKGSFKLFLER